MKFAIRQFYDLDSLRGQQWIFIMTYAPTLLIAGLTYYALPGLLDNFKFLTESERATLHQLRTDDRIFEEPLLAWKPFGFSIPDSRLYTHSMIYFCSARPSYDLTMGLRIIITTSSSMYLNWTAWPMPLTAPFYALGN